MSAGTCRYCSTPFNGWGRQAYCNNTCANAYQRMTAAEREQQAEGTEEWKAMSDRADNDHWDGKTLYSDPGYTVTTHYEATCMWCGELYDIDMLASRRCSRCRGPLSVEPADIGLKSATRGRIA